MLYELRKAGGLSNYMRVCFEKENIGRRLPAQVTWYNKAMEYRRIVVEQVLADNFSVSEFCKNELLNGSLA